MTDALTCYKLGYSAGERLYQISQHYQQAELRRIARQETSKADLPLTMQSHYKDGLLAGYEAKKQETDSSGNESEKRQV